MIRRILFLIFLIFLSFVHKWCVGETRIIHVYVALCDNEHQGIVPVPQKFGNGDDPENNLFWGAYYGVKSFFHRSKNWELLSSVEKPKVSVLERCIFKYKMGEVYLIADGYRGKDIKQAIGDFLEAASGNKSEVLQFDIKGDTLEFNCASDSDLLAYIGHDGLMDFEISPYPAQKDSILREVMIIACISKTFFNDAVKEAGAIPLVWTTGLLAAEAYTLEGAIEGWIYNETGEQMRLRAAKAYHAYQKCGLKAASGLFVTGF
jgi:hypothetical protein